MDSNKFQFGRLPSKPQTDMSEEYGKKLDVFFQEYDDDAHIEERIDFLKKKINLNRRFNEILEDERGNSRKEGKAAIRTLAEEARGLRRVLARSVHREQSIVQSALDTHREFQLALTDKTPMTAIPWLQDKLYDQTKKLNQVLSDLLKEKKNLEEVETLVRAIEQLDENGATPEENRLMQMQEELEVRIEGAKVKREAAAILRRHYDQQIKILIDDNNKLVPTSLELDKTYDTCKKEVDRLESVCKTAKQLALVMKNIYTDTRSVYNTYDKARRTLMSEKRAEMRDDLDRRKAEVAQSVTPRSKLYSNYGLEDTKADTLHDTLVRKQLEVKDLEAKVLLITQAMRVPNISFCAPRMNTSLELGLMLREQLDAKTEMLELMEKQSEQLQLIRAHLLYTGNDEAIANKQTEEMASKKLSEIEEQIKSIDKNTDKHKATFQQVEDGIIQLLGCLGVPSSESLEMKSNLGDLSMLLQTKVLALLEEVNHLREELVGVEPTRDYGRYVKPQKTLKQHVRLSTPPLQEGDDGPDDHTSGELLETGPDRVVQRDDVKLTGMKILKRAKF